MTDNSDINEISDINTLIELYHNEGKEALEVSKKLEAINVRFSVIRDRITALRHLTEDKSEDEEESNMNEVIEKVVKVKKAPVKKVVKKEVVKKEEVKEEEIKTIAGEIGLTAQTLRAHSSASRTPTRSQASPEDYDSDVLDLISEIENREVEMTDTRASIIERGRQMISKNKHGYLAHW
jgi:hypothetical protein